MGIVTVWSLRTAIRARAVGGDDVSLLELECVGIEALFVVLTIVAVFCLAYLVYFIAQERRSRRADHT
jgi:hypothetical protein